MFKNRAKSGKNNVCGQKIFELRKASDKKMSQKDLADLLQLQGIDIDKNAIQRIESGQRFVTDIELIAFSKIFNISFEELLNSY